MVDDKDKDIKKQEAETKRQIEESRQRQRIDGLLRLYQAARSFEPLEPAATMLAVNTKKDAIRNLSNMITIVEEDDWSNIHPHDAFPKIDIRMLAYECPAHIECPFLLAILRKIGMQRSGYVNYRRRMGMMIAMEHKRKRGKMK